MGTNIIKAHIRAPKLKIINFESKKCIIKKSENPKEKIITCLRFTFNRFLTIKNRKSNLKLKDIIKKLRSSQIKKENNNNGSNINPYSIEISIRIKNEIRFSKF